MTSSNLKQQIATAFTSVGHPTLSPALLSQITSVSSSLRLTPDQLAEAWEAHSLTKHVTELNDTTMGGYRSALAKEAGVSDLGAMGSNVKNVTVISGTGLGKRMAPGSNVTPSPMAKRVITTTTATPGGDNGNSQAGNRNGLSAVDNLTTPSGKGAISPSKPGSATSSSISVITPPRATLQYTNRTNAGTVVASYNPHNLPTALELLAAKSTEEKQRWASRVACSIRPHHAASHPRSARHMFAPLEKRANVLEDRLHDMNGHICEKYGIKNEDEEMVESMDGVVVKSEEKEGKIGTWTPVNVPKQHKVLCMGRICNEAHEGRLNRASIRLEDTKAQTNGSRIALDLQGINSSKQSYSLFPGQIVAVEGVNSSGRTMQASRLMDGAAPPTELMGAEELLDYHHGAKGQDGNPLSIVSMCGPFTTKDNLDYDPLLDAVVRMMEDKPDVVILCGPFVDVRHPLIKGDNGTGATVVDDNGKRMAVSHECLFASKISTLLEDMYQNDPQLKTQIVLVPSVDDAFLDAVYPQPPMEDLTGDVPASIPREVAAKFGDLGLKYVELAGREELPKNERQQRVHCVSNPCTLQINDVTIGVTSTDVLFHISSDECNANLAPGTRLTRIAQHLIQQRSYYPLFPAAKGASLDLSKAKQWEMPIQPDILIVPSKLASFARSVAESTIVVNPGELTKNTTGGTYAVMDVHPMKRELLESGMKKADGGMMGKGVQDRLRVDIKRI